MVGMCTKYFNASSSTAVTFPASEHHRPSTGTKLYCLVTEAGVSKRLAQGGYSTAQRVRLEPATLQATSSMTRWRN